MTDVATSIKTIMDLGSYGLLALGIWGLLRGWVVPRRIDDERLARIASLEAQLTKWQDRAFESLRTTRTVAGVARDVLDRSSDVAS